MITLRILRSYRTRSRIVYLLPATHPAPLARIGGFTEQLYSFTRSPEPIVLLDNEAWFLSFLVYILCDHPFNLSVNSIIENTTVAH